MAIPVGYQLQTRSWDNDGDNYSTVIKSGLTEIDVKFLIFVSSHFDRNHTHRRMPEKFNLSGNTSNKATDLLAMVQAAHEKFPGVSENIKEAFNVDPAFVQSIMGEEYSPFTEAITEWLLDYSSTYDDLNFCRVSDGHRVYHFPAEVADVTKDFV